MTIAELRVREAVLARPRNPWRRRAFVAVLALQFLIPLAALVGSAAPTRLGFQMYSGQGELTVKVVDAGGSVREVDVPKLLSGARLEIDWIKNLPAEYVCDRYPGTVSVIVTQSDSRDTRTVTRTCST